MAPQLAHKRGDTFATAFRLSGGGVADWSTYTVRCQIRTVFGVLIHDFGAIAPAADGTFALTASAAQTRSWVTTDPMRPQTRAQYDIQITDLLGVVRSTPSLPITIIPDVTYD